MNEYDEVKNILIKHDALNKDAEDAVEMGTVLYDELYEYFQSDMPYGVQKAREGEPDIWIADRLEELGLLKQE
jgi:hypothetical protein